MSKAIKETKRQLIYHNSGDWVDCIFDSFNEYEGQSFADLLNILNIEIPDYITYCLISTDDFRLKFRQYGNKLHVFLTYYNYEKTASNGN